MPKLTLSAAAAFVERAKAYARDEGTSVSALVEKMLDVAAGAATASGPQPSVLGRLRGSLKRGWVADYYRHLEKKHQ
jgi:hypothetical protein